MQIANGTVDGHQVAFVDGEVPPVIPLDPSLAATESVTITHYEDDELSAAVVAASPGLVVFSETYAEGWKAYVDGEEVEIVRTNGALRGVPVPGGEHTIEMRYDPIELKVGLWTTGVTGMAVIALAGWNAFSWWTGRRSISPPAVPSGGSGALGRSRGSDGATSTSTVKPVPKPSPKRRETVRRQARRRP